jgi:D-alanyl-D-alanine carboxypeptidase
VDMSISEKFEKVFDKIVASNKIHECVCFIENGSGDFAWSKGYGGKELESPMLMASITKLFTTTCIIKLLEGSQLKLTDKVVEYLVPEMLEGIHVFKGTDYSAQLTIANLLFQTSGLPDWFLDGRKSYARRMVREDFSFNFGQVVQATKEIRPKFPPDTPKKAYYTDINFDLLGKIIEQITALSLQEVYENFIIKPLKLKNTYLAGAKSEQLPAVYYKNSLLQRDSFIKSIGASGGGVSNAIELMSFIKAFWSGKLFDPNLLKSLASYNRLQITFYPVCYAGGYMRMEAGYPLMAKTELLGHSGSTGSFAFFASQQDLYYVGDVNQFASPAIPIRFVMKLALAAK